VSSDIDTLPVSSTVDHLYSGSSWIIST